MGRGSDCDIKISDISVSRTHAQLIKERDDYFIEDLKSKFGTLCKIKGSLEFEEIML